MQNLGIFIIFIGCWMMLYLNIFMCINLNLQEYSKSWYKATGWKIKDTLVGVNLVIENTSCTNNCADDSCLKWTLSLYQFLIICAYTAVYNKNKHYWLTELISHYEHLISSLSFKYDKIIYTRGVHWQTRRGIYPSRVMIQLPNS